MSVRTLSQQKLSANVYNKRKSTIAFPEFKAASSGSFDTLTVATHAAGDLMLAMGWGAAGSTVPVFTGTPGAGDVPNWTRIGNPANGIAMYYAFATKSNHTFGAWSSGSNMTSITISNVSASPIGAYSYDEGHSNNLSSSGNATTSTSVTGGPKSLVLYYGAATSDWTPVTGFTTRHSAVPQWYLKLLSRNDPTTAPSSNIFGTTGPAYWAGSALEIK